MPAGLSIVHVLRAPVGGLFRHVRDLTRAQASAGHAVGVIADAGTGGDAAEADFSDLARHCALGVHRLVMSRLPGPGDMAALQRIGKVIAETHLNVLHGHGAKGGSMPGWQRDGRAPKPSTPRMAACCTINGHRRQARFT